jgi:hypothetical protein
VLAAREPEVNRQYPPLLVFLALSLPPDVDDDVELSVVESAQATAVAVTLATNSSKTSSFRIGVLPCVVMVSPMSVQYYVIPRPKRTISGALLVRNASISAASTAAAHIQAGDGTSH